MSKPRNSKKKSTVKKDSDDTRVSLHPMTLDEALKKALGVKDDSKLKMKLDDEDDSETDDGDDDLKDSK